MIHFRLLVPPYKAEARGGGLLFCGVFSKLSDLQKSFVSASSETTTSYASHVALLWCADEIRYNN